MATTQIADVYTPEMYTPQALREAAVYTNFLNSGIMARNEQLTALANGPSRKFTMPYYNDIDDSEPNIGSDDPAENATPEKITSGDHTAIQHYHNKGYSFANLANALAMRDPVQAVYDRIAANRQKAEQKHLIYTCMGVLADNLANDGGDMEHDHTTAADEGFGVGIISLNAVLDGAQTMGDHSEMLNTIAMHSIQLTNLRKQKVISKDRDPTTGVEVFMLGEKYRVIVDDGMPVDVTVPATPKFHAILFGPGAIGYGVGTPAKPSAVAPAESAGNGEGVETLWVRDHIIMHPQGFSWTDTTMVKDSPSWAELQLAVNWDRSQERKRIPMAFVKTLG